MYNLSDLINSKKTSISTDSAIVFIVNDNASYYAFLKQCIYNILHLHEVEIYVLCLNCAKEIQKLLYDFKDEKLFILNIEFESELSDLETKFKNKQHEFQYIKPIALNFLINKLKNTKKYFLYLDADTFPIRNLQLLFNEIHSKLLIIKELGVNYRSLGYETYVNSMAIYNYFDIPIEQRWGRREPPVNTGVIGFNIHRDYEVISSWLQITTKILRDNLKQMVKWWDQGCFMLALESLNKKNEASDEKIYNYTILNNELKQKNIHEIDANIIHFIGDQKINIIKKINKDEKDANFLEIAVAGHTEKQFFCINPRSYLKYTMLSDLNYSKDIYSNNSIGESRVFLANNVFKESSEVVGTVSASWNKKYYPNKIDHILNWPQFPFIEKIKTDPSMVVCATICSGSYSKRNDPLWIKNFQTHFRNEFKQSEWVEKKLYDITGLKYDGIRPAPYANQIICHKTVFYELSQFMKKHIDKIIEEFTLNPEYNTPDPNRSLAYTLEELSMLWWSSQKEYHFIPVVEIQPNWYKK
jgi:hypothetical protein